MIPIEVIDEMYDVSQRCFGRPWSFFLFDKRAVLSFPQAVGAVRSETGREVAEEELRRLAAEGLIPLLELEGPEGTYDGVPLYAPSRAGLLLSLEEAGYAVEELRQIANAEEGLVDELLTTDELTYIDDDLECLIAHLESRVADAGVLDEAVKSSSSSHSDEDVARWKCQLGALQEFQKKGVPSEECKGIEMSAFRVRAYQEFTRLFLLESDRAKVRAGFSPSVSFRRWGNSEFGRTFEWEGIEWEYTIACALATDSGPHPTIRVPAFCLKGESVTTTSTLSPTAYGRLWKQYDLDRYLHTWARRHEKRRCLHCLDELPDESSAKRLYCSPRCRNAAKQKRFRDQNPEKVFEMQRRYFGSVRKD